MTASEPKHITYYASNTKYYYNKNQLVRYIVQTPEEKKEFIGGLSALGRLGDYFAKFYITNRSDVILQNGAADLEESSRGKYRKLFPLEEKILLSYLNLEGIKVNDVENNYPPTYENKTQSIVQRL